MAYGQAVQLCRKPTGTRLGTKHRTRHERRHRLALQYRSSGWVQFVDPYVFDRLELLPMAIIPAATLALAQAPPVGGRQRSSVVGVPIHIIRLHQLWPEPVAGLPVRGYAFEDLTIQARCEIGAP